MTDQVGQSQEPRQEFYAGVVKPRELAHDAQLHRAYLHAADRLRSRGAVVQRVLLDYDSSGTASDSFAA